MAVPTHFRFTIRGIFKGTEETWSNVFHFSRDNPQGQDANLGDINEESIDTAVAAFYGSGFVNNLVEVADWRMYVIGTDGKMEGNAPLLREYVADELKGAGTSIYYPPQIALCMSTVALNRGAAQFGRWYVPGPVTALDNTLRITVASAQNWVTLATQFLKDLSDSIDLELTQSSEGLHISKGPPGSSTGTRQTIDHVRVGRVFDTMQSRRRSLLEDYQLSGHIDW